MSAPEQMPRRAAPHDPVAKLAEAVRRLGKKEAKAEAIDAELGVMLRRRVREMEGAMVSTVATSLQGILAQLRILEREPVAPWIAREIGKLVIQMSREGVTEGNALLLHIYQMGAVVVRGESHPCAKGLAVALAGTRALLDAVPARKPDADTASSGLAIVQPHIDRPKT